MLHRIFGRAKSGKTERIMQVIGELIKSKKHAFLIVPEQQALIAEREIIERFGNTSNMYVEVINFKRLCNRVFRETGGLSQSYIDTAHKLLIMSEAIESVKEALTEYKTAATNTDFSEKALAAINEFKQFGVSVNLLEEAFNKCKGDSNEKIPSRLASKIGDLSLIYSAYNAILSQGFEDNGDDLDRLFQTLEQTNFFDGDTVLIDAFYGFTVQEIRIIERIISSAADTYITFLYDKNGESELFSRALKVFGKFSEYATLSGIEVSDEFLEQSYDYASPELSFLEKNFSTVGATQPKSTYNDNVDAIRHILCQTPFDEADAASAVIKDLVMNKGVKYGEIAVCARNIETYEGICDTSFTKNEIPFNYNVRLDLMTRPVIAFVLSAFEIIKSGWNSTAVIRHIKTGLTALDDNEADLFECYVRTWSITGSRFLEDEWQMNPDGYSEEFTSRGADILEKVNTAKQKLINPLCDFSEEIRHSACADEISRAVFNLLLNSKKNADKVLLAKLDEDGAFWNLTMDALDCISQIVGQKKISATRYAELFKLIMNTYDAGKIPETVDEVTVSSAEGLRGIGIKYIIILGVNDGIFPATPTEDSIFSDRDKKSLKELGIELSDSVSDSISDEMFLAYKVISCASSGVVLLSSEMTTSGDDLYPSIITSIVSKLFPSLRSQVFPFAGAVRFMFSKAKLFDRVFIEDDKEAKKALELFFDQDSDYAAKFAAFSATSNGGDSLSSQTAALLYGHEMTLSPSRLESYGNCEFSYFGSYILRLKAERKAALGALETGNIAHKILELLVARLSEQKLATGKVDLNHAVQLANELLDDYIQTICGVGEANKTTKRFDFLYKRLSGTVCELAKRIAEEISQSSFVPKEFELPIGLADNGIKSVEIPLPDGGKLKINGKVDRTDVFKKGEKTYIRVVDYKTGTKRFSLSDVVLGTNLQMLLYLYSICSNGEEKFGSNLVPAGVLYVPVKMPEANDILNGNSTDAQLEKPNGILIDDFEILQAMEAELSGKYIPVKVKRDGDLYANSSVITLADMGKLLKSATDVSAKLAREIKSGSIKKNPIKCKQKNSCAYCDLAPFCRHDYKNSPHTRFAPTTYLEASEEIKHSCQAD